MPTAPTAPTALVERDEALAAIDDALGSARAGVGRAVFLVAEPGVGKSALLEVARRRAGTALSIRSAHGASMERDLAFSYIEQCIGGTGRASPADPLTRRSSIHDLARRQLRSWARSGPLLVLLDDLQWADRDSLDVIGFLARRLAGLPVAVIGATRRWPHDAYEHVQALDQTGAARAVELPALSRAACDELLARLVGGDRVDQQLTDRAWALARGNPLLVEQAARVVADEGDLPAGRESGTGRKQLRRTVLLSHLTGMPAETIECARAAAVLGTRVRVAVVEAIAGVDVLAFARSFDVLAQAGIFRDDGDGVVRFSHDVLAAAIYEDMAPARRRELHRLAFAHFVERADVASAAPHALAADLEGDERAIRAVAEAAALALTDGATGTAMAQLEAAVRLAGPKPPNWLLTRQADTLFAIARPAEALEIYRRLLGRTLPAAERVEIAAKAAHATTYTGRLDEALLAYDELLDDELLDDGSGTAPLGSPAVAIRLERAHVMWELGGPAAALSALPPEPPTTEEIDGRDAAQFAQLARSFFALEAGDPDGLSVIARASAAALRRIEADPGATVGSLNAMFFQVHACVMTERYDEALRLIDRACGQMRGTGQLRVTLPLRVARLGVHLVVGDLATVLSGVDDLVEEFDLDELLAPQVQLFRATALAWQGNRDEAWALCRAADAVHDGARSWFAELGLDVLRGRLLLAEGRNDDAADALERVHAKVISCGVGQAYTPKWSALAVEAALAAGRLDQVERVVAWLAGCDTALSGNWPRMIELAGRAGCAAARGADEDAGDLYRQALALPTEIVLDRAVIAVRYGAWLRRRGRVLEARPILSDALRVADERGAKPLAGEAQAELAAAGGRRRAGFASRQLTAQERRVAELAAEGATTREIAAKLHVSVHTVESHLTHAYLKLGVTSKRELRDRRESQPSAPS